MSNPLKKLEDYGQSPWIDMISREMLDSGTLERMIREDGLKGLTSNPSIFDQAISSGKDYDPVLEKALAEGIREPKGLFERMAAADIRDAADALKPVFEASGGADGYVSLEVSPKLAFDTPKTIAEGKRLFKEVGRPNLMIKVPATKEGLPAVTELLASGVNVNVTLIFAIERYRQVMEAYLAGVERLAADGGQPDSVASVASFFVSRIDVAVDKQLPEGSPLRGKTAVANAKLAYQAYKEFFGAKRFLDLKAKGARPQRALWASTSTKDPKYSDVLYIDSLIGPDTVNTIPPKTWDAFRDHGKTANTLEAGVDEAKQVFADLKTAGVDLKAVTDKLEKDGVASFAQSFESLLHHLEDKAKALA